VSYIIFEEDDSEDKPSEVVGNNVKDDSNRLHWEFVESKLLSSHGLIFELPFELLKDSFILSEISLLEHIVSHPLFSTW